MTSYSQSFFGKELNDLKLKDIRAYFATPQSESNIIEFKSYGDGGSFGDKLKGIKKTICALLNSEGGIIIWGAPKGEKPEGQNEEVFTGDLCPIDKVLEKDRLINLVSDSILPLPNDIKVRIFNFDGQSVCVFEVGKSSYSPHQFNNYYYMRMDGQSRIAPHYYVEALFKKIRYPNIEGYIKFNEIIWHENNFILDIDTYIFNFSPELNEYNLTMVVISEVGIFQEYLLNNNNPNYGLSGHQLINENIREVLHYGTPYNQNKRIIFDFRQLMNNGHLSNLSIMFGGKYSPMKKSDYDLNLAAPNYDDANSIIMEKKENITMYETQQLLGITKDEQLKKILGR